MRLSLHCQMIVQFHNVFHTCNDCDAKYKITIQSHGPFFFSLCNNVKALCVRCFSRMKTFFYHFTHLLNGEKKVLALVGSECDDFFFK